MTDIHSDRILILDFGSQYSQIIARRVRELHVYCEVHAYTMSEADILAFKPKGIILSGGPETVTDLDTPRAPQIVFEMGVPVLGICYGMQTMALQLGGEVVACDKREFGYAKIKVQEPSSLLRGIGDHIAANGDAFLDVWMSHGDQVVVVPPGFVRIASTDTCDIAGMASDDKRFFGLQFHPEVSHTLQGMRICERFVIDICGCQKNWTLKNIIDEQIAEIKRKVGSDNVILGLSGGVDSSVAAALLQKALGKQLYCVFVDTGLLRLNEREQIQSVFEKHLGINLIVIDAADEFYHALAGVFDPEEKRKIIGRLFIEAFDKAAQSLPKVKWLSQGTIYSDVIESAGTKSGKAHVIKSHHNVGGLPKDMPFSLLEPLRELFKDEVRKMGVELGLPFELVNRHPFPGPGLGVRILGEVKREYADILRLADAILIEELYRHDLYYKVSQAFAVFLPVKSVGVVGDARQYEYVVAIRAVETIDFMTAHSARLPYEFLEIVSRRIINEVKGISRVTYDISSKPPATIEWE